MTAAVVLAASSPLWPMPVAMIAGVAVWFRHVVKGAR